MTRDEKIEAGARALRNKMWWTESFSRLVAAAVVDAIHPDEYEGMCPDWQPVYVKREPAPVDEGTDARYVEDIRWACGDHGPQAEPDRCPTCGSREPMLRYAEPIDTHRPDSAVVECINPWHSEGADR